MRPTTSSLVVVLALATVDALVEPSAASACADAGRRSLVLGAAAAACSWGAPPLVAEAAVAEDASWMLPSNVAMPKLALNTAGLTAEGSERATLEALAAGITHVDFHPGIERDGVAKALAASGRSKLFLTTKIKKPCAARLECLRPIFCALNDSVRLARAGRWVPSQPTLRSSSSSRSRRTSACST
jgi:hypothetical protein